MSNWILMIFISIVFSNQSLWDLGVIVEKDQTITYQKELDINNLIDPTPADYKIKALHSNNFIPPIIHEIKTPSFIKKNIVKKYDEMLSKLSLSDKILAIKKSFLNKEFSSFFNSFQSINKDQIQTDATINLMYIQNLYFSNQFNDAQVALEGLNIDQLSEELLLYKIKVDIKLKNIQDAISSIDYFINKFPNSDLMNYVVYEQKLITNRNHD